MRQKTRVGAVFKRLAQSDQARTNAACFCSRCSGAQSARLSAAADCKPRFGPPASFGVVERGHTRCHNARMRSLRSGCVRSRLQPPTVRRPRFAPPFDARVFDCMLYATSCGAKTKCAADELQLQTRSQTSSSFGSCGWRATARPVYNANAATCLVPRRDVARGLATCQFGWLRR